jgi:uncharacterized membrane protein
MEPFLKNEASRLIMRSLLIGCVPLSLTWHISHSILDIMSHTVTTYIITSQTCPLHVYVFLQHFNVFKVKCSQNVDQSLI